MQKEKILILHRIISSTLLQDIIIIRKRLTDLVLPFHGEFHQQLLGVGADEDKWGSRLLTDIRELQERVTQKKGTVEHQLTQSGTVLRLDV